ncbi:MAG TPA: hypothetical protein VGB89_05460, partial [Bacteroidota bacterium]
MHTITPQLPRTFEVPDNLKEDLKTGAYRLSLFPNELFAEDRVLRGTLRVVREGTMASASADLYVTPKNRQWGKGRIPVFPVDEYRGYARVIGIEDTSQASEVSGQAKQTFNIEIDYYLFDHSLKCWNPFGKLKLEFTKGESEFESEVKMEGERLGRLSWQVDRLNGDFVREATVVIHGSVGCNMPGGVKSEERKGNWQDGFKEALWHIEVEEKRDELNEEEKILRDLAKSSWKENDLREKLDRAARTSAKQLNAWYYHLFCVSKIEGGYLGLM